jgi:microcystin-dependent protein
MPAPPDIYVNQSTSLVQVDTSQLVADQSAVVLLSSITSPGLLVTIRDFTGNAGSNIKIVVSTTQGLHFLDDVNKFSYTINQPYGFLTVTPKTPQIWAVLNTFAFPPENSAAIIQTITATNIYVSSIYGSSIQTNYGSAVNMSVFSSIYTNSLTIGSTLTVKDFTYFGGGISTIGSAVFFSSVQIQGGLSVFSSVALGSSLFVTGDIRVNGELIPSNSNLVSTVQGLGNAGYVSTTSLTSTVQGLGSANYVSTTYLGNSLMSTVQGLGSANYVSTTSLGNALLSTVQGLGSANYVSTTSLGNALLSTVQGLGTVQYVSTTSLTSTVQGLGSAGYMSTAAVSGSIISTVQGLGTAQYVSSSSLTSTVQGLGTAQYVSTTYLGNSLMSTVQGLGSVQYVSSSSLISTVQGLGSAGYMSTAAVSGALISTVQGLGTAQYVSSSSLTSTVRGLGSALYVSTTYLDNSLRSTVQGLGSVQYVSSSSLTSTVRGLGSANYVSTTYLDNSLRSTVQGLGSVQYVSSSSLTSTVRGLGSAGYVSSFNNVSFISSQRFVTSSIGVNCNFPRFDIDVHGEINAFQNIYVNGIPVLTGGTGGGVTSDDLSSTVRGLGTAQYISSTSLTSTVRGLGSFYVSSFNNISSISSQQFVTSSIGVGCNFPRYELDVKGEINASQNIFVNGNAVLTEGTGGGVVSGDLISTVRGLGTSGYVSSFNNVSSISSQRIVASSIGIGCNAASYTLDINGQVNVSGKPRLTTWVSVGSNVPAANNTIKYSITSGSTWQNVTGGFSGYGSEVAWNGSLWVAVGFDTAGTSNTIFHSSNGSLWIPANIGSPSFPFKNFGNGIAWGNSLWIAVGDYANSRSIITSSDGSNWLNTTTGSFTTKGNGIAWNGYMWVAVGQDSSGNTIKYSVNGLSWTNATSGVFTSQGKGVAWNGYMWVAVGSNSGDTNNIKYSYDGSNWENGTNGFVTQGTAVAWNGNMWVATGTGGDTTTNIKYSYDGTNWSNTTGAFPKGGYSVAWSGNRWIAGGAENTTAANVTKFSVNGINWSATTSGGFNASTLSVAYSQTIIPDITTSNLNFYMQSQPNYLESTNQILATASSIVLNNTVYINKNTNNVGVNNPNPTRTLDIGATLETINNPQAETTVRWVALVNTGTATNNIIYTKDGSNWLNNTTGGWTVAGKKVVWGGDKWVACGPSQLPTTTSIIYSFDGIAWNNTTNSFNTYANSCAYGKDDSGNPRWVAVGSNTPNNTNTIKYSGNGIDWIDGYVAGSAFFSAQGNDVTWNGIWSAVGLFTFPTANFQLYSSNGIYWYFNPASYFDASTSGGLCIAASCNVDANGLIVSGGRIVAGGYSGTQGNSLQYTTNPGTGWSPTSGSFYFAGTGYGDAIGFNGSRWVAVGTNGTGGATSIKYSDDGKNWSNSITPYPLFGTCVTWSGNMWMLTNYDNFSPTRIGMLNLYYSYDGINWLNNMTGPSFIEARAVGGRYLPQPQNTSYNLGNISMNVNGSITQDNVGLPPVGSIIMYAGLNPPIKWIICDGKSLNTTTFSPLFSVIGYLYGGSGANFNVPNLSGRVPIGCSSNYGLTQTGGEDTHTLTEAEMPSHSHTFPLFPGGTGTEFGIVGNGCPVAPPYPVNATGGGLPHNNMQPFIVLNYIIRAFP